MTNVSAVEKMAELMQQMEENSPRVAALQYCLTQVAEKVEEAEKRNAELEARCAALSAENSGLKSAIDATIGWQQSTDPENVESVRMLVDVKTPVTDAFLAEVLAQGVEMFEQWCRGERDFTLIDEDVADAAAYEECVKRAEYFAAQLRKGGNQ
ncbi:TPA: hypothetical protein SI386_004663 [Escherichia coli]|nr:hypothetical protein [Escherichia coli]MDI0849784.1 hypothetical protein [Escherichia coli]HEI3387794.1 hypothetical protein [Escherichia coli]